MARVVNEIPEPLKHGKKPSPEYAEAQALAKANPRQWVALERTSSSFPIQMIREGAYGFHPAGDWEVRQRRADDDEGRKGARFNVFIRYIGGQS